MNRSSSNTHALLVEIMVAVLFFALCTAGLLEAFAAVHRQGARSAAETNALNDARSVLEQLNASDTPENVLTANGFAEADGLWRTNRGDWALTVATADEDTGAGTLTTYELKAEALDSELFTLHGAHYQPREAE